MLIDNYLNNKVIIHIQKIKHYASCWKQYLNVKQEKSAPPDLCTNPAGTKHKRLT